MRSSFCESSCAPFNYLRSVFCCCLPSSVLTKDAPNLASIPNSNSNQNSSANPVPIADSGAVSASIDEKSSDEKVDVVSVSVEEVHPKSCLKQPNGERRGNVKWMDLLGKELVEVQEYEPRYSESIPSVAKRSRREDGMHRISLSWIYAAVAAMLYQYQH